MTVKGLGISVLLVGCTGGGSQEACCEPVEVTDCRSDPMVLELGWGRTDYMPLDDLDEIQVVFGNQGGWHFDIAGDVGNTGPEVSVDSTLTRASTGELVAENEQARFIRLVAYDETTCRGHFVGAETFVPTDTYTRDDACALDGEVLELCTTVGDLANEQDVTECTRVVARIDAADLGYFCAR